MKRAFAEIGDSVPKISVAATLDSTHPWVAAEIASAGDDTPLPKIKMRNYCIEDAFTNAMADRGHKASANGGYIIGGELVTYSIYEPMRHQRMKLTRAELASRFSTNGKDWQQVKVPSGTLAFHIQADYGHKLKWQDGAKQRLEDQLDLIVFGMEFIAARAAEKSIERGKQHREYVRKREREERLDRLWYEKEERWGRLCEVARDHHHAQQVRSFLSMLKVAVAGNKPMTEKANRWIAWTNGYLRDFDPVSYDPAEVFQRLAKPKMQPDESGMYGPDEE